MLTIKNVVTFLVLLVAGHAAAGQAAAGHAAAGQGGCSDEVTNGDR